MKRLALLLSAVMWTLCGCDRHEQPTLSVWIMRPGNIAAAQAFFDAESAGFERTHPGIRVRVEFIPWLAAHDKLVTALAGDVPPDISELGSTWTAEFAAVGALRDLDRLDHRLGGRSAFVPALADAATLADGHVYGIPWYAGTRALLYRKSVFARARLEPPRTLADLARDARALSDPAQGTYGFALMGNNAPLFYPIVWEYGGDFAAPRDGVWHSQLAASDGARKALAYVHDLYRDHTAPQGAITWSDLDGRSAFAQGTVAMTVTGSWALASMFAEHPDVRADVGIVPFPSSRANAGPVAFVGGSHLVVYKRSHRPDLAEAFIAALSRAQAQRRWATTVGFYPGRAALVRSTIPDGTTVLESRVFADELLSGKSTPPAPGWGEVEGSATIPAMIQSVLSGQATESAAIAHASAEIDAQLDPDL